MRLARETRAAVRVGGKERRKNLERDVAPQLAVVRAIHLAHAACAHERDDLIRAEMRPCR